MSEIRLYRLANGLATELQGAASDLEKPLQRLIEANLQVLLGIRFLATEHTTGKTHAGRIDTLGLDENSGPVIIEYKRSVGESVINQGLYYLDWLMDHQAEFQLLVQRQLGAPVADAIDWSAPRLVCIAADFTKFDGHAVKQMNRNIDLIRYRQFGPDLLLLEQVHASSAWSATASGAKKGTRTGAVDSPQLPPAAETSDASAGAGAGPALPGQSGAADTLYADMLGLMPDALRDLMVSLEEHLLSLGDDVQRKELKVYVAFKRLRNFATLVPQKNRLLLYLHIDPVIVQPLPTNARDVGQQGHWGTGDLELTLTTQDQLDAAKPLILMAYEGRAPAKPVGPVTLLTH